MKQIIIENILITFSRKNIKNINLRITSPDGEVKVSAPKFISMNDVEKFISSRKDWIIKSQEIVQKRSQEKNKIMSQLFSSDVINDAYKFNKLKKSYAHQLIMRSKPFFAKWKDLTGLYPNKIVVRWPKTLWGSCEKSKKLIMLNGMLLAMDDKYLDYVILHELAHLKYSNHGKYFKKFMTEYMPNWYNLKKEMNHKYE